MQVAQAGESWARPSKASQAAAPEAEYGALDSMWCDAKDNRRRADSRNGRTSNDDAGRNGGVLRCPGSIASCTPRAGTTCTVWFASLRSPGTGEAWLPCRSSRIGREVRESRIVYRGPRELPHFLQISRCPPCALKAGSASRRSGSRRLQHRWSGFPRLFDHDSILKKPNHSHEDSSC